MEYKDTKGHWGEGAIKHVTDMGIMQGAGDGNFVPDRPVTRAELATVIARMNGYKEPVKK